MLSKKDIEQKNIIFIDSLEEQKKLSINNWNIQLESLISHKVITRIPFHKALMIIMIGNSSITSPLLDKLKLHSIPLIMLKRGLKPILVHANIAEANFLLRKRQYEEQNNLFFASAIIHNKILNQLSLLTKLRKKDELTNKAKYLLSNSLLQIAQINTNDELLGIEGYAAKLFFQVYFADANWQSRMPRTKVDYLNSTLDIGYTILFNYLEANIRLFGFDIYVGVFHKLWCNRKSLVCDLIEPFRCIIDKQVRKSINLGQFSINDFELKNNKYILKPKMNKKYITVFFEAIKKHKMDIFSYVQSYYRFFMGRKSVDNYQNFQI